MPLCSIFPRLFQEVENKYSYVQEMGWWSENAWSWQLDNLNVEATTELVELQLILAEITPKRYDSDGISWLVGGEGVYAVRDYYCKLIKGSNVMELQADVSDALKVLWQSWMPLKVKIFGWRLLQDRLATRDQLVKRGILENDNGRFCVFGCL